jgi:hypothetical protein
MKVSITECRVTRSETESTPSLPHLLPPSLHGMKRSPPSAALPPSKRLNLDSDEEEGEIRSPSGASSSTAPRVPPPPRPKSQDGIKSNASTPSRRLKLALPSKPTSSIAQPARPIPLSRPQQRATYNRPKELASLTPAADPARQVPPVSSSSVRPSPDPSPLRPPTPPRSPARSPFRKPVLAPPAKRPDSRPSRIYVGSSKFTDIYQQEEKLGEGTFGVVFKASVIKSPVDARDQHGSDEKSSQTERKVRWFHRRRIAVEGDKVALKKIILHNESEGVSIRSFYIPIAHLPRYFGISADFSLP